MQQRERKRKEKNNAREMTPKKKDAQKEPNDLQQFCAFHSSGMNLYKTWHQKRPEIIKMIPEGFPEGVKRAEAEKTNQNSSKRAQ